MGEGGVQNVWQVVYGDDGWQQGEVEDEYWVVLVIVLVVWVVVDVGNYGGYGDCQVDYQCDCQCL